MHLLTDHELLHAYAIQGSEAAFAQLVERHLPLVWSAARRQMPDAHLAEDVAQQVFALLAQKAASLGAGIILPGWLYRTTSFVAARALRGEHRRREREVSAVADMTEASSPSPWREIEPLLDQAMTELSELDRDAVVLRFFENKSLHEVGIALGTNEDAVQKRLSRAVEKLQAFFVRHGKSVTVGTLTTALATGAIQPAPATLAASISALALSSATTTGTSVLSLMSSAALKTTFTVTAGLAAAVAIFLQQQRVTELRAANDALQAQLQKAEAASAEQASRLQATNPQREAEARQIQSELLRLRGEVSQLRQRLKEELAARKSTAPNPNQAADTNQSTNEWVKTYKTEFRVKVSPKDVVIAGGWRNAAGHRVVVSIEPRILEGEPPGQVAINSFWTEMPDELLEQFGLESLRWDETQKHNQLIITADNHQAMMDRLKQTQGINLLSAPRISTLAGRQAQVKATRTLTQEGVTFEVGPALDVIPYLAADGESLDLSVFARMAEPTKRLASSLEP